ncbi:DUF4105 domain-containing protein [Halioglobus maricola]|uniref:DUF4105 domain-containing protein n=1 Tax=Halioglobus maricola TaxID=2601894 RepID=A0A5P9NKD9_9GAMM|nr:DUF4105 domain-containing protein [Halioglobus maricola]QFU76310.1 DUF4105 domain-containing protein [Halioglobus maricola]
MKLIAAIFLVLLAGAIYLSQLEPGNSGPWQPQHSLTPEAKFEGRTLRVKNVRDFRYAGNGEILEKNYRSLAYDLNKLERMWFGLSHFGPSGLAHSFLSFEFSDGQNLALSVEARLTPEQNYSPVLGLFRQYTKIYVLSTESDVIGLRSHYRKEKVLLYPVIAKHKDEPEIALRWLLEDANEARLEPQFYNTVLDNCLTSLLQHSARFAEISWHDARILLPGRTDRLTYAFGMTPDTVPFDQARAMATIHADYTTAESADFSEVIRCGWHDLMPQHIAACP